MPKKHTPGFKTTKPQAGPHSSLTSRSENTVQAHSRAKSVNERLQELRVSQGRPFSQGTVSELGDAQRQSLQARRAHARIAGPPPPRSWTSTRPGTRNRQSQGLGASRFAYQNAQDELETGDVPTIYPPPLLPHQPLPQTRSLRATALRLLARNLSWHIAHQHEWLDYILTPRIKSELVAVIALWSLDYSSRLNKQNMRYLFGPQKDSHGRWYSGGEGVTHLSFGSEIKRQRDYTNLARYLKQESSGLEDTVPDSWDDNDKKADISSHEWSDGTSSDSESDAEGQPAFDTLPPSLPFLPSLTHLSLARPSFPCWPSLIEIGSLDALCHLTHLDLSYWPAPTLIASVHDSRLPLQHVGTTVNTRGDKEREVIRVFNQLGRKCRKLVWLGLEGCESWLPSLLTIHHNTMQGPRSRYDIAGTSTKPAIIRADWTGIWRGLETLKVVQSWIPRAFTIQQEINDYFLERYTTPTSTFLEWWQGERRLREEELQITQWRLEAKLPALKFDKTPIQSSIDLEIRTLGQSAVISRWKDHPLMQDGIDWTTEWR